MSRNIRWIAAAVIAVVAIVVVYLIVSNSNPSFPNEALRAIEREVGGQSFTVVSTSRGSNPEAFRHLTGAPDEVWCVIVSPPLTYIPPGFSTRARDNTYFLITREGLLWQASGQGYAGDGYSSQPFLRAGCTNG